MGDSFTFTLKIHVLYYELESLFFEGKMRCPPMNIYHFEDDLTDAILDKGYDYYLTAIREKSLYSIGRG